MTRIIQRCLLVLAYTGLLLSSAQETTVSDISDLTTTNHQTSTSAPESSSFTVQNFSSAPVDKAESESSFNSESTASSSASELSNSSVTYNDIVLNKAKYGNDSTSSESFTSSGYKTTVGGISTDNDSTITETSLNLTHSEGLLKSEINEAESDLYSSNLNKLSSALHDENVFENGLHDIRYETIASGFVNNETSTISFMQKATEDPEMRKSSEMKFESVTNNSGHHVPSVEDFTFNSNYESSNPSSEKISSTYLNKVQTEDYIIDLKGSTQKRSLNSTNVETSSGTTSTDLQTDPSTSFSPVSLTETAKLMFPESSSGDVLQKITEESLSSNAPQNRDSVTEIEITPSHMLKEETAMNTDDPNGKNIADKSEQTSEMVLKTSPSSVDVIEISSKSSVALSTSTGDSIHNSQTVASIAETSHLDHFSTVSSTPHHSLIELEDGPLNSSDPLKHEEILVTFDPNGMTNNYTQDPDSVTFSPEIFHVDGMPTNAFLSRLETNEFDNIKSTGSYEKETFDESAVDDNSKMQRNFTKLGSIDSSEREREFIPSNKDLLPHDEPDKEELNDALRNTKPPFENKFMTPNTLETRITDSEKSSKHFLNDESEEMLNDAPQVFHSEPAPTPREDDKEIIVLDKNLIINGTSDISSVTSFSPYNTPKAANELDFSIVYNTEESVIRPVTVAIPSESSSLLPGSFNLESLSPSAVPKSEQPDTVLPDISSPVILPNPAPSIANQSEETSTVVLQPIFVPESNRSEFLAEGENDTTLSSNSTISGVAVKTSVSVSLPLSVSNESSVKSEANDNVNVSSESELPRPVSIPISNGSDTSASTQISSEAPKTSTESSGPKIFKPKLKIGGTSEPSSPRTRKPLVISYQRASTTAGPPVSIFKKSRTRIASITSSTTAKPFPKFSTMRVHYASRTPGIVPGGELIISTEPITTTIPTTTETEEPFSDEPFTEQTQVPIVTNEDAVTLIRVAGYIVFDKGLRWTEQLDNRHSPQYKEKANFVHLQLERLFRTSTIAPHLWKIQIDGFSGITKTRSVAVDFFLFLVKSKEEIPAEHLKVVFHEKLINNTFSRFTVDTTKTSFELVNEEPLKAYTPPPEKEEKEPVIPQWAIAVIVVGAASLIFIILFAAVAILGRHHVRRRYSNKLDDEDSDRPGDWESKMAAAYENLAADTIYDADDLHSDNTYKKSYLMD